MNKIIIEGNIIFPDRLQYGQLVICNEIITEIIINKNNFIEYDFIFGDDYISPGFIDIQINGAFGKEFKTDNDAIEVISNSIFKFGTTSFCPTITTSEFSKYKTIESYEFKGESKIIGFHLEGPMLNPKKVGAQNTSLLKLPIEIDFESYINSKTKIVTLSPELDGSNDFILKLKQRKIKIGIGHSTISYESLIDIFDEENMMIVHLFNAMDGLSSREPGLVGAGMNNDNYIISIIVDGIHLHPATLRIIWKTKINKQKIICISDGSAVTGLDNGVYQIGERIIHKSEHKATLPNGTLVGSILTLNVAIKNLIKYCDCTINEAVNTVSLNPAMYLGLENEIGQIKIGNKADLVIFDSEIDVKKTFINGKLKYSQE